MPPLIPEIALHLAEEAHGLWLKTEAELDEMGVPPPFWAFAWAGGQALARYLLDHANRVEGRRVLDFASGSGLVAFAATRAGAARVTAVDIDPFCREAIAMNAALNRATVEILVADIVGRAVEADLLVAGDVFFDRAMSAALVPWFDRLSHDGLEILVGDPGRAYCPGDRLEQMACYSVPTTRVLEDADFKESRIWRWRPERR
ncbi:class I SAM-dependent methyltransferase [Consotaella aegiceratis]|uniref:class I SAM-dependent methyltransferase n=1 Tax=Consotaella aegiceratis TaxID=3097961 RepID=UPI002F409E89